MAHHDHHHEYFPGPDHDHLSGSSNMATKIASMPRALAFADPGSRSSFSSVRENDDGLAQTFTRSKISSYTQAPEEVFDESPSAELPQSVFQPPLTQPHSKLHRFLYPADGFRGWRHIPIKGKKASKSCEDLRSLHMTWDSPAAPQKPIPNKHPVGKSPLETLPPEITGMFPLIRFLQPIKMKQTRLTLLQGPSSTCS